MNSYAGERIKWPYVTHRVDHEAIGSVLPPVAETRSGALVLARVTKIGRHKDLENVNGRRLSIFEGDLVAGVLGNRYATDQYEGAAICTGTSGHILGIGGVLGQVVSKNERMPDPTELEWIGRLADHAGRPLELRQFGLRPAAPAGGREPRVILSLGASMNSGKTTTAAQLVRSLYRAGRRVAAAKITGTACLKDPILFADAGACRVVDFTDFGYPATAGCSREELRRLTFDVVHALRAEQPEYIVAEIADGVFQRETRMMLEDPAIHALVDAVTFAGPDALSCESGVRLLDGLGYNVLAVAGPVANGVLGQAEAQAATGRRCLSGAMILGGALVEVLEPARAA